MQQTYKQKERILGKDLLLDKYGDIIFDNNDLVVTIGTQGVTQRITNKLKSFLHSLFAHPEWGGFFQSILSQNMTKPLLDEARQQGINEILEEPEVLEIKNVKVNSYPHVHLLTFEGQILYGTDLELEKLQLELFTRR